ncbi:MAG: cysteine dioxygenase family protein [Acidobacteria bacterium]|nr:cysteine dioxygenase family protein [Acidobacteriota bacterium]
MQTFHIDRVVQGLREIRDEAFTCDNVYDFLGQNPIDRDSITKYFFWSPDYYTRNLIYKDDRFEVMAICWEVGQVSRVHDHSDQKCWMTVPIGRLQGQNFAVDEIDPSRGFCKLSRTDVFELADCLAAKVELEEPIHQVLNLDEYDERAVSVHIYSKPYTNCNSYCLDTNTYKNVPLCYTSIGGKLVQGASL